MEGFELLHLKNQGRKAKCEAGGKTSENASRFCDVKGTDIATVVGDDLTDHWDNLCFSVHLCSKINTLKTYKQEGPGWMEIPVSSRDAEKEPCFGLTTLRALGGQGKMQIRCWEEDLEWWEHCAPLLTGVREEQSPQLM